MNIFEQFQQTLVETGKWFSLDENASIELLPMGSDKARRAFDQLMEPYQPRLKAGGRLSEDENKRLNLRFYSETIVLNWKGLKGQDGKDIKHSKDAAFKLFEALPRFLALIIRISSDDEAFAAEVAKEDEGNSSPS